MAEFVGDQITPAGGGFDMAAMGRGEPGLPSAFKWRGETVEIDAKISVWKHSERESSQAQGELYLRRHYFKLRMADGLVWTVYFIRQPSKSGSPKARWFLYTIESNASRPD